MLNYPKTSAHFSISPIIPLNITPQTIQKNISSIVDHDLNPQVTREFMEIENLEDLPKIIKLKEREMLGLSKALQFEQAAIIRDEIRELKKLRIKS